MSRLREENERLRRWERVARALDAENATLKANLHWIPEPAATYVTAPVVADAGGVYARAVLLSLGPNHGIRKGQIALDDRGPRRPRDRTRHPQRARAAHYRHQQPHSRRAGEQPRPRHPRRHQWRASAADVLAGGHAARGRRARRHQRRSQCLPRGPAGRHRALLRKPRPRGPARGAPRPVGDRAAVQLRPQRHRCRPRPRLPCAGTRGASP